jgi:hypothetical protein
VSHESYPVVCDRCGNRPIGTVIRHDVRCGCSAPDWEPNEPPKTWFEYRPDRTPLASGHEPIYRIVRGDPSDPDATIDAFCNRHGRLRFTVGDLIAGHPVRARSGRARSHGARQLGHAVAAYPPGIGPPAVPKVLPRMADSTSLSPTERSLRSSIAGLTSWAATKDRTARTEHGRDAFRESFEDPSIADPVERAQRAEAAYRAHFAQMAFESAKARRKRTENAKAKNATNAGTNFQRSSTTRSRTSDASAG